MNKQELIELWKDAPEGATDYRERVGDFYKFSGGKLYWWLGEERSWEPSICEFLKLELTPRPEPLIYTKAMHDAGELPPIGSKAVCDYDGFEHLIIAHDLFHPDEPYALVSDISGYWGAEASKWSTIDTRSDTEKASDDLDKLGYNCNASLINSIKAGKIHGVTWSGGDG